MEIAQNLYKLEIIHAKNTNRAVSYTVKIILPKCYPDKRFDRFESFDYQ